MHKLPKSAREKIRGNFAQHPVYRLIKSTETDWFDLLPSYRLSVEQVFCEVMTKLDELKDYHKEVCWHNLYVQLTIDYRQEADDVPNQEITYIVTIIVCTLFSILGISEDSTYHTLARHLAMQCAEHDKGFRRRSLPIFETFEQSSTSLQSWLDDQYMHPNNEEHLSQALQRIITPTHYSTYFIRNLNLGKSDEDIHANLLNAANKGATALAKYFATNEGKLYYNFRQDEASTIIKTLNTELGTNIKTQAFQRALSRHEIKL